MKKGEMLEEHNISNEELAIFNAGGWIISGIIEKLNSIQEFAQSDATEIAI